MGLGMSTIGQNIYFCGPPEAPVTFRMASKTPTPIETNDLDLGEMYTRSELFLEKNKKGVTIAVVVLLAAVGGLLGYKHFISEPNAHKASDAIWKAQYYFETDSLDLAINGDGNYFGFQDIANKYGSTPAGNLAKYYLALCYHQKGEWETALNYYKAADLEDDILRVMATGNQGDVLVELGRPDEALAKFEKAANMVKSDYTTPMFLMKAGILYQQKSDWGNAAKCFDRVATDYPGSPDVTEARKYAAHARAMGGKS